MRLGSSGIYLALLEVNTNQKRFQCERPRERRAVLRERKEGLGPPVNKVDRVEGRSWFQSEEANYCKGNDFLSYSSLSSLALKLTTQLKLFFLLLLEQNRT